MRPLASGVTICTVPLRGSHTALGNMGRSTRCQSDYKRLATYKAGAMLNRWSGMLLPLCQWLYCSVLTGVYAYSCDRSLTQTPPPLTSFPKISHWICANHVDGPFWPQNGDFRQKVRSLHACTMYLRLCRWRSIWMLDKQLALLCLLRYHGAAAHGHDTHVVSWALLGQCSLQTLQENNHMTGIKNKHRDNQCYTSMTSTSFLCICVSFLSSFKHH